MRTETGGVHERARLIPSSHVAACLRDMAVGRAERHATSTASAFQPRPVLCVAGGEAREKVVCVCVCV
ncbi:hypothetical protein EON67_11550 [archaeon]|nr:MAG: hypothetical protein EON67_11550 [archaeon]